MDLVLKALTEPEPFSWEGRYYQYRTVSVWPWPVQRPLPPLLVATRSADTVQFAASRRLGLGVSYEHPDDMAGVGPMTTGVGPAKPGVGNPTPTTLSIAAAYAWPRPTSRHTPCTTGCTPPAVDAE